jgi:hypothetical protein
MVTSKCTQAVAALFAALLLLAAPAARAQDPDDDDADAPPAAPALDRDRAPLLGPAPSESPAPSEPGALPSLHHAPIASAPAGEPLTVRAIIDAPHLVKTALVVYRAKGRWYSLKLLRAEDGYAGTIPAEHVQPPGLAYAIEMEDAAGARGPVFATRADPQPVIVRDDPTDVRERWLLDRLGGRRSVVSAGVELVRFGTTTGAPKRCGAGQEDCTEGRLHTPRVDDQYIRAEASYTYRPLRTVSEFGFRLGVVRGESLVDLPVYEAKRYDVGLNFAGANVRFRLASILHADLELMGSVTEIGFSTGAGAAVVLGDPFGTKFTVGWQTVGFTRDTYFGTRFYTRLDLKATERITVAPNIEITDMPHAERFGVRLLADGGFVLGGGFTLWVRGGYQARISRSGGPTVGTTLQFAF